MTTPRPRRPAPHPQGPVIHVGGEPWAITSTRYSQDQQPIVHLTRWVWCRRHRVWGWTRESMYITSEVRPR